MNTVYNEIYKKIYCGGIFESITDKSSGNTEWVRILCTSTL